jgi:hypothetical protein
MNTTVVFDSNSLSADLSLTGIWNSNQQANGRFLPNPYCNDGPRKVWPGLRYGEEGEAYAAWVEADRRQYSYALAVTLSGGTPRAQKVELEHDLPTSYGRRFIMA